VLYYFNKLYHVHISL